MSGYLKSRGFSAKMIADYGLVEEDHLIKIPYQAEPGEPQLYKLRLTKEDADRKYYYQPSGQSLRLFDPAGHLSGTGPIEIYAGEIDCLTALALGRPAIGCPGESAFDESWAALFKGHERATIIFDGDDAGRKGALDAAAKIISAGCPVFVAVVPEGKDVNELYLDGWQAEDFKNLIESAEPYGAPKSEAPGILLSDVTPEAVDWLWDGYIPHGKIIVSDGDPGLGKSTAALDIAARVSTGRPMPDGSAGIEAAGVVILSAEDGLADTIRPRLDAAGADCSKIVAVTAVPDQAGEDRPPVIPDDLDVIARAIERVNAKLLIIDPLVAYLSGGIQSNRDQDVRRALHQVANLAEATGVAVLVVRHLNKSGGGNSMYRGGGSIGIIGAARAGFLIASDPDDENRRVMAPIKSNLCKAPSSLAFHLEDCGGVARVVWDGASSHSANALLFAAADQEEGDALREAKEILRDILSKGPVAANEAKKQARDAGVSEATLRRAKEALGVGSHKDGMGGGWLWELPEDVQPPCLEHFEHLRGNDPQNRGISAGHAQDAQGFTEGGQTLELKPQVDGEDAQDAQDNQDGELEHLQDDLTGFEEVEL